jgi:hypothetical protein
MSKGTNTEILGKPSKFTEVGQLGAGRPKINAEIVIKHLKMVDQLGNRRYTNTQIGRMMGCTSRTVRRIFNKAVEDGLITPEEEVKKIVGVVEADFEAEMMRATGMSFRAWLYTRFKASRSSANTCFNFNSRVWSNIFEKCSLVDFRNLDSPLADQMAIKFVTEFQEDNKRMRARLKKIRFMFRFLSRKDVCDRHLMMEDGKHPRAKRDVPEITNIDFPLKWQMVEDRMVEELGEEIRLYLRLKICTQMRTGTFKSEREFYGMRKGTRSKSYLYMNSPDEYNIKIFAKKLENWNIIWLPQEVREMLWEKYQTMEDDEQFATLVKKEKFVQTLRKVTLEILGREFILHDLRKISISWFYIMGIPLEVCINLNVGWKDLNTATSNYLDVKSVLRKSKRVAYRENIPDWFKEGLDDFQGFEAIVGGR